LGWIKSIDFNFQDERLEAQGMYPVKLQNTPAGFAYIDFTYMTISTVPLGQALASPSPSAQGAYASIIVRLDAFCQFDQ
jgi:SLT domain-containing protein